VAVAHLPAAVSLLLLQALFMQISGMSLTLTWPCRLCLLRVLLGAMPLLQDFPFPSTLGEVTLHQLSQACVFIYSSRGKWSSILSCEVFLPPPLLQAFLLPIAEHVLPLMPSPADLFIYSSLGKWSSTFSYGVLLLPLLLQAFLLLIAGCVPALLPSPAIL
jgi:hypothetical protein